MRKLVFIIVCLLWVGCRTVKTSESKEKHTEIEQQTTTQTEIKEELLQEVNQLIERSQSNNFESNLNLVPTQDSKVVRYVEMREGKPYRDISIEGGSLQERKQSRDTLYIRDSTNYKVEFSRFQRKIDSLQMRVSQLEEQLKTTEKKGNGRGWTGWIVVGILILIIGIVIWIMK